MSKLPISNSTKPSTVLTIAGPHILSFLSAPNLASATVVDRGFHEAVQGLRLADKQTVVRGSLELWRRSFPNARCINLTGRVLTDADFVHLRGILHVCLDKTLGFTDAAFSHLTGVQTLSLIRCTAPLTDAALAHITGVKSLNISYTRFSFTDAGLAHLRGIKEFLMPGCSVLVFSDAGLAHLVGIKKLDIDGYSSPTLTDAAFEPLCAGGRLEELDIGRCKQFTEQVCRSFRNIKKLSITCLEFTEAALEPLESIDTLDIGLCGKITRLSPLRGRVKHLNMRFCSLLNPEELAHLRGIESLDLSFCTQVGDEHLSNLVGIKKLSLEHCTQTTLTHAAFAPLAPSLKVLNIAWCRQGTIGDRAFQHFGGLEELNMEVCNGPEYTDACLGMIPRVRKLDIHACYQLTRLAIQNLARTNEVIEEINFGPHPNVSLMWQGVRHRDLVEEAGRFLASRASSRATPARVYNACSGSGPASGGASDGSWPRGPPRESSSGGGTGRSSPSGRGGGASSGNTWPRGPPRERRSRRKAKKTRRSSKKN